MIEFFPAREVVVQLFGWQIRWYGFMYGLAFWGAFWLLPKLGKYRKISLSKENWAYIVTLGAAGALVGGRLGYVLLYDFSYFLSHPGQILNLAGGGMSSHGGFVGVALVLFVAAKKLYASPMLHGRANADAANIFELADVVVIPVAFGLALGRLGNFINQELYVGYWALIVAAADALIGLICLFVLQRGGQKNNELRITGDLSKGHRPPPDGLQPPADGGETRRQDPLNNHYFFGTGRILALFLVSYSIVRFLNEYVRIQEWPLILGLTRGQLFTIPIFLIGIYFWFKKLPK